MFETVKRFASSSAVGRVSFRSQSCPPTTITGWLLPSQSKVMGVPSLDVTLLTGSPSDRASDLDLL